MKLKKILAGLGAFIAPFIFAVSVFANDQGADNSKYQGYTFVQGQGSDKFGISQVGGIYNSSLVTQATYNTQVSTGIAQGLRMHTYIWLSDGSDQSRTKTGLDYFLPKIQTPKGSIVAIDYEAGASTDKQANTANVEYALQRIKDAGYTPMLYSYKSYLDANLDYESLAKIFGEELIWIAGYPHSYVTTTPDYSGFPSHKYVAIWQFTDYYKAGGLDGNVDLLGVTKKGYDGTSTASNTGATKVVTNSTTTAIKQGQTANNTSKSEIKAGYNVKVNFSATKWANDSTIPSWVKGKSYTVQQVSGSKVLLKGILSWVDKSNVEIVSTGKVATTTSTGSTVKTSTTGYNLVVDGKWPTSSNVKAETTLALQKVYDMKYQDGKISNPSALIKVIQKHLGVKQDGKLGPITIVAGQRRLGTPVDGKISSGYSMFVAAMQKKLNAGVKPF